MSKSFHLIHPLVRPDVCAVPTSARPQTGESIPAQKWNSPQDGQVHYRDAAAGTSNDRWWSSVQLFSFSSLFSANHPCAWFLRKRKRCCWRAFGRRNHSASREIRLSDVSLYGYCSEAKAITDHLNCGIIQRTW